MDINEAKNIFKENFIGPNELNTINNSLKFKLPNKIPDIDLNITGINPKDYILILGVGILEDNTPINIKKLISIFEFKITKKLVL